MNIKKILVFLLAIVSLFAVLASAVSCGDDFEGDGWVEKNEKTMKSASYKYFNDEKYYAFSIEGTVTVTAEIVTESGEFGARVYRKELPDAPIFTMEIHKNDKGELVADITKNGSLKSVPVDGKLTETFAIASDGDYILQVKGVEHKGSYKFDW